MDRNQQLVREIRAEVSESLDLQKQISDEELREMIRCIVFRKLKGAYMPLQYKREFVDRVFNSLRRFDILQPLIDDQEITEVMVNGPDDIFVEKYGRVSKLPIGFESRDKLNDVIQSIVAKANRSVNEANPIVDFRLQDGSRVNAVLEPVALDGPIITIRKFPDTPMTMDRLTELGSITREAAAVLDGLVKARYNIFICGGTGSGKTTLLNALSGLIPADERIITIEDSAELQIKGIENIVRLETRNPNTEGKGRVTIRDLIRTSLRMRPERIIVGEVRGEEALDMLQAMNTGHDGSISTGHGNSPADMISRLETMVLTAAPLPLDAIRQQIASAIDIVIHLSRLRDKTRRMMEITEVVGCFDGKVVLNSLFEFVENGETEEGFVNGTLKRTGNKLVRDYKLKMAGVRIDL